MILDEEIYKLCCLYELEAFERRRYMNLVVHRARHPQLREYIHSAINGLLPSIEKVCIVHFSLSFNQPFKSLGEIVLYGPTKIPFSMKYFLQILLRYDI